MQLHPASATGLHWHDKKPASAWSPRQRDGTADARSRPAQPSPPSGRPAPAHRSCPALSGMSSAPQGGAPGPARPKPRDPGNLPNSLPTGSAYSAGSPSAGRCVSRW